MPLYGVQSLKEVIRLQEKSGTSQSQVFGLYCERIQKVAKTIENNAGQLDKAHLEGDTT